MLRDRTLRTLRRRHNFRWIVFCNATEQFAVVGLSRNDGGTILSRGRRVFETIKAQSGLLLGAIWSVAEKATVRENRSNIAAVTNGLECRGGWLGAWNECAACKCSDAQERNGEEDAW